MQLSVAKTRLGKRLKSLFEAIPEDSKILYDLCCDHGYVGRAVLENKPACKVIFNDINLGITESLTNKLEAIGASGYHIHTGPAEDAYQESDEPATFVLAGIGDEQSIAILKNLLSKPTGKRSTYIVSPATKAAYVRDFLSTQPVELIAETTVTENRRTYEIIIIRAASDINFTPVSLTGECWHSTTEHQKHIEKLIRYYEPKQPTSRQAVTLEILADYKKILKKIKNTA